MELVDIGSWEGVVAWNRSWPVVSTYYYMSVCRKRRLPPKSEKCELAA